MKLNAVGVTTTNLKKTVEFYELLGFRFPKFKDGEQHLESSKSAGSAKLMIDSEKIVEDIIGETPKPGNHSSFAIEYDSAAEVNDIAEKIEQAGFEVVKKPWDAFWGQRYAVVEDPDGYKVDLYAPLNS